MRPLTQSKAFLDQASRISLALSLLVGVTLSGCGAGKKVISDVQFDYQQENGDLAVSMDATLARGGLVLPKASFPLYNPKNPSQRLGEIQTDGLHIIVNVDASAVLKLPDLADGSTLPNQAELPLQLPAGLKPIGIPAFNSNSRAYVAVNGDQILVGAAVTIAKEDRLNLPLSIFLPFTISQEIHGTGGFFLGEKQGVAVFALREKTSTKPLTFAKSLSSSRLMSESVTTTVTPKIEVKSEPLTSSKVRRLERTWNALRHVRID